MPRLFDWLKENGNLSELELHRTFNCGIGMVIIIKREDQGQALKILNDCGEKSYLIGVIKSRLNDESQIEIN
jgi:phosphoribosylformylglycinamidine cyclo-ligase